MADPTLRGSPHGLAPQDEGGAQEIIARGMRAEKYLEESRYYFGKLREAYKESIARAFEGNVEADVTKYAAQLSVLADIEQQLETLSAEGSFEGRLGPQAQSTPD